MKLLLHICCGPCSLYVIDTLKNQLPEVKITGYFYNPNIHPYDELIRRLKGAEQACFYKQMTLIKDIQYNLNEWKRFAGDKNERCIMCYEKRFEKSAQYAWENGYTHYTSTLFISPYQDHDAMNVAAKKAAAKFNVTFLEASDFTEGFREGQDQAKSLGLYRQKYCGCIRSLKGE